MYTNSPSVQTYLFGKATQNTLDISDKKRTKTIKHAHRLSTFSKGLIFQHSELASVK